MPAMKIFYDRRGGGSGVLLPKLKAARSLEHYNVSHTHTQGRVVITVANTEHVITYAVHTYNKDITKNVICKR